MTVPIKQNIKTTIMQIVTEPKKPVLSSHKF